jgi:hypothetical protein
MPQDTRTYEQRRWDALVGITDGFESSSGRFLAARATPGTVLLSAPASNVANAISRVDVGFTGALAANGTSQLIIQNGGTTVFTTYLAVGNNAFTFQPPLLGSPGNAVQVIVSPGGGTTILNVHAGTVTPFPYTTP